MNGKTAWQSPPNAAKKKAHEKCTHRAINGANHAPIVQANATVAPSRPAALTIEMGRHSKTLSDEVISGRKKKIKKKKNKKRDRRKGGLCAEGRIWKIEKKWDKIKRTTHVKTF